MTKNHAIAFDAKRAFHNFSGLGNYSRLLLNTLAEEHPDLRLHLFSPKAKVENLPPELLFVNLENVVVHSHNSGCLAGALWRSYGVSKDVRDCGAEIFHGLSGEIPLTLPCKGIVTMHDMIFSRFPKFYYPIDRFIYTQKARVSCKKADKIIAISKQTADDIIEFAGAEPSKIEIIYQSCNPMFYKKQTLENIEKAKEKYLGGKAKEKYLICVGSIAHRKNQHTLVKALQLVKENINILFLGGKTKYQDEVIAYAKQYGTLERCIFVNNARVDDMPALYQGSEALIYPSLFEGFGIPILEAMAGGTPVLTSNTSSMPEAGGDAAIYFCPTDHCDMAAKIQELLNCSEQERNQIIEKGYKQAKKLSPSAAAQNVYDLYSTMF